MRKPRSHDARSPILYLINSVTSLKVKFLAAKDPHVLRYTRACVTGRMAHSHNADASLEHAVIEE